jgi:chromate reductase, NAD(P)H dehydrogenase (quinone)
VRILGVSGSLRRGSHNTALLRAAAQTAPPGVALELYDGLRSVPPFDEDRETATTPPAVAELRDRVAAADALLVAMPEYNSSVPGQLKNAVDWLSRPPHASPLLGKPVAVIGASTGLFGAVWAQADLGKVLGATGAHVIEGELPVAVADEAFAADGALRREVDRQRLAAIVAQLAAAACERRDGRLAA